MVLGFGVPSVDAYLYVGLTDIGMLMLPPVQGSVAHQASNLAIKKKGRDRSWLGLLILLEDFH